MPNEIHVRAICESDLLLYKQMRLEALKSHPEAFGSDFADHVNDPDSVWLDRIRSSLEGNAARIFLADASGELAGMAGVYREIGTKVCHSATIVSVYVRSPWRGRRLAEQMIREALAWCGAGRVRIARLAVATSNASAIRCYHRCGFHVVGVQPEVIRVGDVYHDEMLMWRRVEGL